MLDTDTKASLSGVTVYSDFSYRSLKILDREELQARDGQSQVRDGLTEQKASDLLKPCIQ